MVKKPKVKLVRLDAESIRALEHYKIKYPLSASIPKLVNYAVCQFVDMNTLVTK